MGVEYINFYILLIFSVLCLRSILKMRIFIAGSCAPVLLRINSLISFIVTMGRTPWLYPERGWHYDHSGKNTLFPERIRCEGNSHLEGRGVLGCLRAERVQCMASEALQGYEEIY